MVGSYTKVGAISVDFKNFKRDLQAYMDGRDAQLVIDKFFKKQEVCSSFYFDYDIDEHQQLNRIFWADPMSRRNYAYFGDIISVDATYSTNRYNLVFVPFTGVDNHKRCITFAAGLLTKEDIESYVWLMENFKNAMGQTPNYIVTDQDPAMKVAVGRVFPNTPHRFCMWHIMTKVGEKVGVVLAKNEDFRKKLNAIVWNEMIHVDDFEYKWRSLMEEYGLVDHNWFSYMFDLRSFWIPAYFKNMFMGGLIRTTSRSEAENSLFGSFSSKHSSLVEFLMHFESAIDAQRHIEAKLNSECEGNFPDYKTPLSLERHAASIYTIAIFYEVQAEIVGGCFSCRVISITNNGETNQYEIKGGDDTVYHVQHNPVDNNATCECGMYTRVGLLCRHIFLVYKDCKLQAIPPQYVVARWTRRACVRPIFDTDGTPIDMSALEDDSKILSNQLWSEVYTCVGLASVNTRYMEQLIQVLKEQRQAFMVEGATTETSKGNKEVIRTLCRTQTSSIVTIRPPVVAKNKGSGKRIKGNREKAIEESSKPKRLCRSCNKLARHDNRNCPNT